MSREKELERELADVKEGYRLLDTNWSNMHEAAMGSIRRALKLPQGTVYDLVCEIERLQRVEQSTNPASRG